MTVEPIDTELLSAWELADPADRQFTFSYDRMHNPNPFCPLSQSVYPSVFIAGILRAARELELPIADWQVRFCNGYAFDRSIPIEPASEEEARILGERAAASIEREMHRMRQRWDQEHLPRILQLHEGYARIRAIAPDEPLNPAIVDELLALDREMWLIHFRIGWPLLLGQQLFDELIADLAGPETDSHALLAGQMNRSIASGIAISDLAASTRALGLAALVLDTPNDELRSRLGERAEGVILLAQIDAFLEEFGLCQDLFDLYQPTWQGDPAPLYAAMRGYLTNGVDNRLIHEARVRQAQDATATLREHIASYPQPIRDRFEIMLEIGRNGSFLHEEHNFYIDQMAGAAVRLAWLAIARQLVRAGRLADPTDIFYLSVDEIRDLLAEKPRDMSVAIGLRRASLAAAHEIEPPEFIGAPKRKSEAADTPIGRAFARFTGVKPRHSDDPTLVPGTAGSRGVATAPAFVAHSLTEAGALPAGHVLVAVTTSPSWTPLFGIASAVVTETGGPLAHCAIVAREYGIPAVVGATGATKRIVTGQLIRVDGTTGDVMLLS